MKNKNKLYIYITFLIGILTSTVYCQSKLNYFIKGGINFSNITNYQFNNKPIISYNIGVGTELKINKKFNFQPEMQLSLQGWKDILTIRQNFDQPLSEYKIKIQLYYLNIPLLTKLKINEFINFNVGPQIGYLVSTSINNSDFQINNSSFNKIDYGVLIGTDITIKDFFIDLRYYFGLAEVLKIGNSKNSLAQLAIGYKFN